MTDYSKLKVDELKKLLSERNLPVSGKKADFVARLVTADGSPQKPKLSDPISSVVDASKEATTKTILPKSSGSTVTISQSQSSPGELDLASAEREAKLAARAKRFGMPQDEEEARRKQRNARFGTQGVIAKDPVNCALSQPKSTTNAAIKSHTNEPQQKRPGSILDDPIEAEKARKRALKFGLADSKSAAVQT